MMVSPAERSHPELGHADRAEACRCGTRLAALLLAARAGAELEDAGADGLLTPDERHVLLALFLAPGMPCVFDPAPRSVAEALRAQTGLSTATVRRALRVLEHLGYVHVERRGRGPHRYVLGAGALEVVGAEAERLGIDLQAAIVDR